MSGLYIKRFVDRLQQLELKGQRDFHCPMSDAKNLHNDITKLLADIQAMHESSTAEPTSNEITEIKMDGGSF